jgi:hypothetical protein
MTFSIYSDPTFYKNGLTLPSGSVFYSGATLQFLQNSVPPIALPCNANLNQVLNLFDQAVNNLLVENNLTQLTPESLTFNPATISIKGLHQVEINAISANIASILSLQTQLADLNVGILPITINMQCLASIAAPCESGVNTYQLIAVLNSMLSEICALKTAVGI